MVDSSRANVFAQRAFAYIQKSRHPEALADCDRAIGLDRSLDWVLDLRAEVHRALGQHPAAKADSEEAVRIRGAAAPRK